LTDAGSGKRLNHPANLAAVYAFAGTLLGEPLETLAVRVEDNFLRLFGGLGRWPASTLTNADEPPPTQDVSRGSCVESANGGWFGDLLGLRIMIGILKWPYQILRGASAAFPDSRRHLPPVVRRCRKDLPSVTAHQESRSWQSPVSVDRVLLLHSVQLVSQT